VDKGESDPAHTIVQWLVRRRACVMDRSRGDRDAYRDANRAGRRGSGIFGMWRMQTLESAPLPYRTHKTRSIAARAVVSLDRGFEPIFGREVPAT